MDQAIDIGEFMGSWTLQMGYPIVHVKLTGENTVQISQMKYKFPGEVETESPLGLVKIIQCYFGDIVFGKILQHLLILSRVICRPSPSLCK